MAEQAGLISGAEDAPAEVRAPEGAVAKYWDAQAKALKVDDLAKGYNGAAQLLGKRFNELSVDDRRLMVDVIRPDVEGTLRDELKTALAADEDFLSPLRQQWLDANKPAAPEQYALPTELPEGVELPADDPLVAAVMEVGKTHALPQEAFTALVQAWGSVQAEHQKQLQALVADEVKKIGPDHAVRAKQLETKLRMLVGDAAYKSIDIMTNSAEAFMALEKLVASSREKPMPPPNAGAPTGGLTEVEVKQALRNPEYWKDPVLQKKVTDYYKARYTE